MEFGSRIKRRRQELNFSQQQVANHLYVSRKTISHWENGNSYPDIGSLIKLSDYFQISLDPLIKADTKMEENLKKREVKKSVGLPYYLSLAISFISAFVGLAGLSLSTNSAVLNLFFGIIVLSFLNILVMTPIMMLREKHHLKYKREINLIDSGILWLILAIIFILVSLPLMFLFNSELGGAFIGSGIMSLILGIDGLVRKKKKAKNK